MSACTAPSRAEATRPPSGNLQAQQVRFNRFRHEYNDDRPHEALDQETPGSVYQPSPRALPRTLAPLEYPGHFEVRLVSRNSGIRWKKHWVCVTHTLASALKITRAASSGEDRPRRPPSHGVVTPTMCSPCPWTDLSLMSPAAQLVLAAIAIADFSVGDETKEILSAFLALLKRAFA